MMAEHRFRPVQADVLSEMEESFGRRVDPSTLDDWWQRFLPVVEAKVRMELMAIAGTAQSAWATVVPALNGDAVSLVVIVPAMGVLEMAPGQEETDGDAEEAADAFVGHLIRTMTQGDDT